MSENTYEDATCFIAGCEDKAQLLKLSEVLIGKVRLLRAIETEDKRGRIWVGSTVEWFSKKRGEKTTGVVMKVNRTRADVQTVHPNMTWSVPLTLLERV